MLIVNRVCCPSTAAVAAGLTGAEGAMAASSSINMTTVVTAAILSAIGAVLVSLLVVLTARQVQQWRSNRNASRSANGDHVDFNRPARNFAGFGSVSSKLSAMTMSSIDSVTEEA